MSIEKTEGIVIRQADFSESSRVVTLFTRDYGKISAVAKGAKRLKSAFHAAIDLLTQSRVLFIRKMSASLDILTEADMISRFFPEGPQQLTALYCGYYVAELLAGLTEDYDPHPVLYDETVLMLNRLQQTEQPQQMMLHYELTILREIGQLPTFDACLVCDKPITGTGDAIFLISQGGVICQNCRQENYTQNQLQSSSIAALQTLSNSSIAEVDALVLSKQQKREIRSVMSSIISATIGRRPKMLSYLTNLT